MVGWGFAGLALALCLLDLGHSVCCRYGVLVMLGGFAV